MPSCLSTLNFSVRTFKGFTKHRMAFLFHIQQLILLMPLKAFQQQLNGKQFQPEHVIVIPLHASRHSNGPSFRFLKSLNQNSYLEWTLVGRDHLAQSCGPLLILSNIYILLKIDRPGVRFYSQFIYAESISRPKFLNVGENCIM